MSANLTCVIAGIVVMVLFGLKIYFDVRDGSAVLKGMSADRERQPFAYAAVVSFDGLWIVIGFVLFVVGLGM